MAEHDGEPIVAAAVAGDEDALRSLIAAQYEQIWRVCRRIVGNDQDADDATQDALIKVIRNIGSFDQRSKFSTWTYRVASNCALDLLRKRRRHLRSVSLDHVGGADRQRQVEDRTAHEAIEHVADQDAFDAALRQIDEDFRIPLVLRDVATLSYQEIADELDIPIGTVKSRIARGRQALLSILDSAENDADPGNQGATTDVKTFDPPDPL